MSEKRGRRADTNANRTSTAQPAVSTVVMDEPENTIDLVELFYRLVENWKLIVCLSIALAIVSGVGTALFITPRYEATSTIYVLNRSDSAINFSDLQLGTALTQDYIKVFRMWEVHEEVISNLQLPYNYGQMEHMLRIKNDSNTRMIDITVNSPDAKEAADVANEYARVASRYIADTMSTDRPNIMSVALVPTNPVSPSLVKNVMLGFMIGMMIGCGYATLLLVTDDKYKTAEDIRKYTGLATLAVVPVNKKVTGRY